MSETEPARSSPRWLERLKGFPGWVKGLGLVGAVGAGAISWLVAKSLDWSVETGGDRFRRQQVRFVAAPTSGCLQGRIADVIAGARDNGVDLRTSPRDGSDDSLRGLTERSYLCAHFRSERDPIDILRQLAGPDEFGDCFEFEEYPSEQPGFYLKTGSSRVCAAPFWKSGDRGPWKVALSMARERHVLCLGSDFPDVPTDTDGWPPLCPDPLLEALGFGQAAMKARKKARGDLAPAGAGDAQGPGRAGRAGVEPDPGQLGHAMAVAVADGGAVFGADFLNNRVRKWPPAPYHRAARPAGKRVPTASRDWTGPAPGPDSP